MLPNAHRVSRFPSPTSCFAVLDHVPVAPTQLRQHTFAGGDYADLESGPDLGGDVNAKPPICQCVGAAHKCRTAELTPTSGGIANPRTAA